MPATKQNPDSVFTGHTYAHPHPHTRRSFDDFDMPLPGAHAHINPENHWVHFLSRYATRNYERD